MPLSVAYPFVALGICLTAVAGSVLFNESFRVSTAVGFCLIVSAISHLPKWIRVNCRGRATTLPALARARCSAIWTKKLRRPRPMVGEVRVASRQPGFGPIRPADEALSEVSLIRKALIMPRPIC